MTGVLVWKVYREQRAIWVVLATLAIIVLVLDKTLRDPWTEPQPLVVLICMIAYIYGLVAGAMLLAGEREEGTAAFLAAMPGEQLAIWRGKCVAGGVMILAQVLFLWSLLLGGGALHGLREGVLLLVALTSFALLGFAWALYFSGRTRTSLQAILAAALGQFVGLPLLLSVFGLTMWLLGLQWSARSWEEFVILGLITLLSVGLLVASGLGHARLDRLRQLEPRRTAASGGWRSQLAVLFWLTRRQLGRAYIWLAAGALAAGVLLPLEVLVWPLLTLLIGVCAGISVFAGEQAEGTGRFLSEQRLPPGKLWAVKVGVHLLLATGVALLLLIPLASRLAVKVMRKGLLGHDWTIDQIEPLALFPQADPSAIRWVAPYLTLWLMYGFSVGCLCGLLFRKPVIAGFIAGGVSLLLATLWAPSVLLGGLHAWQIVGPPLILLLTTRLLIWPWATGRLGSFRAMAYLTGGLTLAGLWIAGALAYRVVEIPLVEDKLDLAGFERTVAAERKNEAGMLVRTALKQVEDYLRKRADLDPGMERIELFSHGWPTKESKLAAWLDEAFRLSWPRQLAEAARLPLGIVEDLPSDTIWTKFNQHYSVAWAAELLTARGLQLQAAGDPAVFVDNLAVGLGMVRQVRHQEPIIVMWITNAAEDRLLQGVYRWLERLEKRPDLLRRVLALLIEHDKEVAKEGNDHLRATYLIEMNTVTQPEAWLGDVLETRPADREPVYTLVALAWRTPWEQARLQRMVRLAANLQRGPFLPGVLQPVVRLGDPFLQNSLFLQRNAQRETRWRAHELMVALRLFQAETGQPARTLQELTPRILASVPVDPATGKPFGYRLSKGEELPETREVPEPRKVPAGQGILTSEEKTFLVPLPPQER